jgi:rhodanese-related sulfurtransferase
VAGPGFENVQLLVLRIAGSVGSRYGEAHIPDAQQIPVDQLESFVSHASRSTILVFYDSITDPVNWKPVQLLVRKYSVRNVYVLKGGLEAWLSYQRANTAGDIGPSTHRAKLA